MSTEMRVENLLRAADRAEREGNRRLAATLRKMAHELGPPEFMDAPGQPSLNPD